MRLTTRLFAIPVVFLTASLHGQSVYNIVEYGAKPDGRTLCTQAIQSAIDKASAAGGGGTVFFPAGKYLSGTIRLKSNITLRLDSGAVLLGSTNIKDYPDTIPAIRSYTDNYVKQSLIYGEDLTNISLTGNGTIDGQGAAFKSPRERPYENRPYLIRLINCRDISVSDLHLTNSAMWVQHYLGCERLALRNLTVISHANANNDGTDIDGCRDVTISDCVIDSEDDAITLKSTLDKPCENITIINCIARSRCNAIKMGTESNGGFINITISNCVITSSRIANYRGLAGIALETVDGGRLDRITISNITIQGVSVPLFMRLGNRARPFEKDSPAPRVGSFRNVMVSNIVATDVSPIGCSITGLPDHPIENVSLTNIRLAFEGAGAKDLASKSVPELPGNYPECTMFGNLPAYGLYVRHTKGLKLDNIILQTAKPDLRHAIECDDVENLTVNDLDALCWPTGAPILHFIGVRDAMIRACRPRAADGAFLKLDGPATRDIVLLGNILGRVAETVQVAPDVPRNAWSLSGNNGAVDR